MEDNNGYRSLYIIDIGMWAEQYSARNSDKGVITLPPYWNSYPDVKHYVEKIIWSKKDPGSDIQVMMGNEHIYMHPAHPIDHIVPKNIIRMVYPEDANGGSGWLVPSSVIRVAEDFEIQSHYRSSLLMRARMAGITYDVLKQKVSL